MRLLATLFFFSAFTLPAIGQDSIDVKKVKEEILKLYKDWNQARLKNDRQALERLFADGYVWVHGFGYMDDKTAAINDQLSTDSIQPVPIPDLSQLQVYGDVAVLKKLTQGQQNPFYSTSIFVKQDGKWAFAHSQTTLLQPQRKTIQVESEKLASYTGKYGRERSFLTITNKNDTLNMRLAKVPMRKLLPVADNRFFDKWGSEYTFFKDAQGQITHLTIRLPNGSPEAQWKKTE